MIFNANRRKIATFDHMSIRVTDKDTPGDYAVGSNLNWPSAPWFSIDTLCRSQFPGSSHQWKAIRQSSYNRLSRRQINALGWTRINNIIEAGCKWNRISHHISVNVREALQHIKNAKKSGLDQDLSRPWLIKSQALMANPFKERHWSCPNSCSKSETPPAYSSATWIEQGRKRW